MSESKNKLMQMLFNLINKDQEKAAQNCSDVLNLKGINQLSPRTEEEDE